MVKRTNRVFPNTAGPFPKGKEAAAAAGPANKPINLKALPGVALAAPDTYHCDILQSVA
jgi:hypothetical protein